MEKVESSSNMEEPKPPEDGEQSGQDPQEKDEDVSPSKMDNVFKVPEDIAFKRPIFTKKSAFTAAVTSEKRPTSTKTSVAEAPVSVEKPSESPPKNTCPVEESQNSGMSGKSPAQLVLEKSVPLPYKEPPWSGLPKANYSFEILKNGVIVGSIPLDQPFLVIGRLAQCDIILEHPSLSRFHCVIQYRKEPSPEGDQEGFYAYDLGSTHGSFHNKHRMKPRTYYRLHVGHIVKFGGSSRMLILQGPDEDQEPESEMTVTELKAEAAKRAEKLNALETGEIEEEDRDRRLKEGDVKKEDGSQSNDGIDWGMGEDAEEEEEDDVNPFATLNEELYLNDPKKTLRGWFEREGYDLPEYITEDVSPGVYKCKVELPIPGPGGGPLVAIVEQRGKKKAAVVQCAMEACRLLDKQGVLRQAKHESRKRKKERAGDDYYSDSDDEFLDRTGDVQRKRLQRMKAASKGNEVVTENYESLLAKYLSVTSELSSLEKKLAEASQLEKQELGDGAEEDDLDSFMKNLKSQVPDKHKRVNWKLRVIELRKEELSLRKLVNIARPYNKPEMQPYISEFDSQPNLPGKHPFQKLRKESSKPPKVGGLRVHHAFLEEEPEKKIKLSRLDEDT
ncbi:kanadaptin-like [Palaemon carinicauda]|uniref:kanadaptin-like n=1 Tax=Palaemon carinicauda TaxID=392227 RepID=UPI0035B6A041